MKTRMAGVLVVALMVLTAASSAAQTGAPGLIRLEVTIGKSQVIDLKEPFSRVSVTNPAIADVFAITPNQILVNGKAAGVTSLVVFYPNRTMFFDLVVQTDLGLLRERLKDIAPRDEIVVEPAGEAVVLRGTVSNEALLGAAADVATLFAPKGRVVNLLGLTVAKPPQVLLQVHVAEVAREALRELGFSARALGNTLHGGAFPGLPFYPPIGLFGSLVQVGNAIVRANTPEFSFSSPQGGSGFFLGSPDRNYAGAAQALATRGLLRTLAKPNLVTQSGKEAKFISGGEFPFPVAQQNNTIAIEFKEFGISLVFTPVVVDGEVINLRVRPEVSSLDFSQGLVVSGFNIPVVRKNQAFTSINLKDGESFAIAGLINNEVRQQVAKIPVLGDIPILGTLFRSTRFRNNESELLFLVTAKLVSAPPAGSAEVPDPARLMDLRDKEKKDFTMVPGIPGVGDVVERPFGTSNLPPAGGR